MKEKIDLLTNKLKLSLDYDRRNLSKKQIEDAASFFIEKNIKELEFYSFYKKYKLLEKCYTASLVLLINVLSSTGIVMVLTHYKLSLMSILVSLSFFIENLKHLFDILLSLKIRYRFLILIVALSTLFIFKQDIYLIFTNYSEFAITGSSLD